MRNPKPRLRSPSHFWEKLRPQAKRMRRRSTLAEDVLWQELRRKGVKGLTFRRQHAIGQFIVDFYCVRASLVIEVDGSIHDLQKEADQERQAHLESLGVTVLRFSNDAILHRLLSVIDRIEQVVSESANGTEAPSPCEERGLGER